MWIEIRRRLQRPRVHLSLGLGLLGLLAWVVLEVTDRSSTGAQMWLPAVIVPAVTGALLLLAGASWILLSPPPTDEVRCGSCRYSLREFNAANRRCPECGSIGSATIDHPWWARIILQLPGIALLVAGVLMLGYALAYSALLRAGVFDV